MHHSLFRPVWEIFTPRIHTRYQSRREIIWTVGKKKQITNSFLIYSIGEMLMPEVSNYIMCLICLTNFSSKINVKILSRYSDTFKIQNGVYEHEVNISYFTK